MKNRPTLLYIIILTILLFALVFPPGIAFAQDEEEDDGDDSDKPKEIFFWIYNNSRSKFTLELYGPATYTFTVSPETDSFYILKNGWYAFTMNSCNLSASGTFDFTTHKTLIVPLCGGLGGPTAQSGQHYDVSDYIRPANILIRNKTQERIGLYIRTLDEHHFLSFDPLEEQNILFEDVSEEFSYSYIACGALQAGMTRLYIRVPFDLTCGK
ncbi:MAG: hypothetical protein FJ010_03345 [Chloroflexi bacterium]|nr:hypothetical protein [Chloroflexota bacterium]